MNAHALFDVVAAATLITLAWRILRKLKMAQSDIDAMTAKVNDIKTKVDAYTPPTATPPTDGTEDLTGLQSSIADLSAAVDAKLGAPAPIVT